MQPLKNTKGKPTTPSRGGGGHNALSECKKTQRQNVAGFRLHSPSRNSFFFHLSWKLTSAITLKTMAFVTQTNDNGAPKNVL